MRTRIVLVFLLGTALGFVVGASLILAVLTRTATRKPERLAGQVIPEKPILIDFRKALDVTIVLRHGEAASVLSGVRFVGMTPDARGDQADGASGYGSWYSKAFDRWLVLETADGRKTYVPKDAVMALAESNAAAAR